MQGAGMDAPVPPPSPRGPLFIISGRAGRLANRLVLFANFIALATERGYRVMNPTFHSYATLFEATRRDIYCRYPVAGRSSAFDLIPGAAALLRGTRVFFHAARTASVLNERLPMFGGRVVTLRETPGTEITDLAGPEVEAKVRGASVVLVNGWVFRAPQLLHRHGDGIRRYFRPVEMLRKASREAVARLRQNADVVVGVHVRRGDYATWKNGQYLFPLSRYAAWMRELGDQFGGKRVAYLLCSDEPLDAGEFSGLPIASGPGSAAADLYALAECDYVFGPPSTFSQWASFYGNKPLLHLTDSHQSVELGRFAVSDLV